MPLPLSHPRIGGGYSTFISGAWICTVMVLPGEDNCVSWKPLGLTSCQYRADVRSEVGGGIHRAMLSGPSHWRPMSGPLVQA